MATQLPQQEGGKAKGAIQHTSFVQPSTLSSSIIQLRINLESNKDALD